MLKNAYQQQELLIVENSQLWDWQLWPSSTMPVRRFFGFQSRCPVDYNSPFLRNPSRAMFVCCQSGQKVETEQLVDGMGWKNVWLWAGFTWLFSHQSPSQARNGTHSPKKMVMSAQKKSFPPNHTHLLIDSKVTTSF
jgi:hypothetical protein